MNATQVLGSMFMPWRIHARIFHGENPPDRKQVVASLAMIALECWILVITLEYWWFGQIFVKTTLLLLGAILLLVIVPSGLISRRFSCMLSWHGVILAFPAIACCVSIVLLRFGVIDANSNYYIYRIPGLMILAGICISWTLFWKFAGYGLQYKEVLPTFMNRLRIVILIIIDLIGTATCALLIIFIEGVMKTILFL
ncbi:MAG TPA: hypothetical protein VKM55_05210 [Candidatus Lokiarchaeia archaeon]|nr:hypothetical protein [Candidatus Lokiarchaeia archaeon]